MRTALLMMAAAIAAAGCAEQKPATPSPAPAAAATSKHELKKITPSADYPLTTCVVSGEDLGAMGEREAYSYDGKEVQFCCPDCIAKFEKDPATYLAKIPSSPK